MSSRLNHSILAFFALGILELGVVASADSSEAKQHKKKEDKERKKQEKKERDASLSAQATAIAQEARDLEATGDLHRAYQKYLEAEWWFRTKDTSESKTRVREAIQSQTRNLVSNAQRLDKAAQSDAAIAALRQAQQYNPGSPLLSYDLAVAFAHKGEVAESLHQIDECINGLPPGKKREHVEEIRAALITNFYTGSVPTEAAPAVIALNRAIRGGNTDYKRIERDPSIGREPCKQTQALEHLAKIPSLTYDRARCAELDQNLQSALNLLERYLSEAQHAADEEQVRQDIGRIRVLLTLPNDEKADTVRRLYTDIGRYLDKGRLDLVKKSLQQANAIMPEFTESLFQLAILSQLTGDVANARSYYREFIKVEKDDVRRSLAEQSEAQLAAKSASYKAYIEDARRPVAEVIAEFLLWGRRTRAAFVEERLERVGEDLREALALFPLAPEVNELLSMIYLIANKQEMAKKSFDVLWSQGWPVSFFASDGSRVVISSAGMAIVPRSNVTAVLESPVIPFASDLKDLSFKVVRNVSSVEGTIIVREESGAETISPARYGLPAFDKGPFPRSYANHYAGLFQRYLDTSTKFAAESLTKKEIAELLLEAAQVAELAYGLTQAVRLYNTYLMVYWGITALHSYALAVDVHTLLRQRQLVLQDSSFKYVPTVRPKFEMRATL